MKKLFASILLLSSTIFAESSFYIGTGYTYVNESITLNNVSKNVNNNGAKLKIGYGEQTAYAVEFSLNYIDNTSAILNSTDKEKYGFDIELMKAWDFDIYVIPFARVGFGAGKMSSTARTNAKSISYGSFNGTLGTLLPLGESFELELAYEYKYLSYQKTDLNTSTTSPSSHQNGVYVGINYRF
ncbi:outer membrane beta-barrel protein [Sulfurimonas sp. C5]|uniref:outer membrane beta-barrel protein n=1 Tax=Sulfurimonas sp. C5 TaxID=3036947 RepID=UPI002455F31C|nr:outer membrane beta-barrel protein [Sulfurimonas sp. C5]MDH4944678.1 outer membrane beta-barrel protein [Sulfurimonas sp. C5]